MIRHSIVYSSAHPILFESVKKLMAQLKEWFLFAPILEFEIYDDNIVVPWEIIPDNLKYYKEVALYFKSKAVIGLYFKKEISEDDLIRFFSVIQNGMDLIKENPDLLKELQSISAISLKELDYQAIMRQAGEVISEADQRTWMDVSKSVMSLSNGFGSEEDISLVVSFLEDTDRASSLMNKLYKNAVLSFQGPKCVSGIRETFAQMLKIIKDGERPGSDDIRKNIIAIMARLNSELLRQVLEMQGKTAGGVNIAEEIITSFGDEFMASFVEALVLRGNKFDEHLVRTFDTLFTNKDRSQSVASMFCKKLFSSETLGADEFAELQLSIVEMFKTNPYSRFMSEVYRLTMERFASERIGESMYGEKIGILIEEFRQSRKRHGFIKERVRLFLNILWIEQDANDFERLSASLVSELYKISGKLELESIFELFDFVRRKMPGDHARMEKFSASLGLMDNFINSDAMTSSIAQYIDNANDSDMDRIITILKATSEKSMGVLADEFMGCHEQKILEKFVRIFLSIKDKVRSALVERMTGDMDIAQAKAAFRVLRETSDSRDAIFKFLDSRKKDRRFVIEVLDYLELKGYEQTERFIALIRREKDKGITDKLMKALVRSGDEKTIEALFLWVKGSMFSSASQYLPRLIELCGHYKVRASAGFLKKRFLKRTLFGSKANDDIKILCVLGLSRIDAVVYSGVLDTAMSDRSERVRNAAKLAHMKLEKK